MASSIFDMSVRPLRLSEQFIETVQGFWGCTSDVLLSIVREVIYCTTCEGPGGERYRRISDEMLGYEIARVTRIYALSGDSVCEFEERLRREGLLLKKKPIVVVSPAKKPAKKVASRRRKG